MCHCHIVTFFNGNCACQSDNWVRPCLPVTTQARGPIIPSRDPILTPANSELTEIKTESTRDKHSQIPVKYTILRKHLYLTISIYDFTCLQKKVLYTCIISIIPLLSSTPAYSNTTQVDNYSSSQNITF